MLAVDVGGTTTKAEVVDGSGHVVAARSAPTPSGAAAVEAISSLGAALLADADAETVTDGRSVHRAAVVLPGIVDRARGVGVFSANLGWRDLSFGPPLEAAWETPVLVDHDVTVAGLAEWSLGAGRGHDDVVLMVLGTGIAAAVVAAGRLVRGGRGQAGELGHLIVRPGGRVCGCGARGCLETVASAAAITRRYQELSGRAVSGADDVLAAKQHDPLAGQAWDEAVAALADGIIAVMSMLAPSCVVLAGGLAEAGDALADPLRSAVATRARLGSVPEVALSEFGSRAGVVGAALLAREPGRARDGAVVGP